MTYLDYHGSILVNTIRRGIVNTRATQEILNEIALPLDHPRFAQRVFNAVAKERKIAQLRDGDNLRRVCAEEFEDYSLRLDATRVQDSTAVRNILRTRRLANLLINDKGELMVALLPRVIAHLSTYLHSLGPDRQFDGKRQEHIIKVLTALKDNKDLPHFLKRISKPLSNPLADQIIRDTLQLSHNTTITDAHARRAALSAWMCYLRQNIGSCFATAPAIIVHNDQPELFLADIYELLGTGRLKRTVAGIEYSVPLSTTWGSGDLRKPIILSHESSEELQEIWHAPGIIIALEAAGVLSSEASLKEKVAKTKELILASFPEWNQARFFLITTPEEIIQRVLLHHLGLSQQDLELYDHQPKGIIHSGLLMQMSSVGTGLGNKSALCNSYHSLLKVASSAFKSLADNALLKAWEYSLASFAETKSDFTRWNLYSSLGLSPDKPGGIGACLYAIIKYKLDQSNQKIAEMQNEYENVFAVVKQLEVRMRHSSNDKGAQWIQAEYQSKIGEFHVFEELRNKEHSKAGLFVRLFDILIDQYDRLFPQYFQEVYDAELYQTGMGRFDDSPAGFRLLYKHGRSNTSQWTKITNPEEFVDALSRFFMITETELASLEMLQTIQPDIAEIVTSVINHVKTNEFLETAFQRMAVAHHAPMVADPINNWEKLTAKPWAYISGGTMNTLLTCYYSREQAPTEISRWVENPTELLVFLIDTLKHSPHSMMEECIRNPDKSILMHSPTHAFLLKPGMNPFVEAWNTESFTYTWVRDQLILPMERFVDEIELTHEKMQYLIGKLLEKVPQNYQFYFKKVFSHPLGRMSPKDFRYHILDRINHERGLQYEGQGVISSDDIDHVLYTHLPLFPQNQLSEKLKALWDNLPDINPDLRAKLNQTLTEALEFPCKGAWIDAQTLQDACLALLCLSLGKTALPVNLTQQVIHAAQELRFAMPLPILFADTNWINDLFGFLVNPGTGDFELWRIDALGRTGTPMSSWKQWLDGSRKDRNWGVYPRFYEYTSAQAYIPHTMHHHHRL